MSFPDAVSSFLEPGAGPVGLHIEPGFSSCDNSILFSAEFIAYLKLHSREDLPAYSDWFKRIMEVRTIEPGCYKRHPHESWPSSWDDHFGASVAGYILGLPYADNVWAYGKKHFFRWNKNFLARIPLFFLGVKWMAQGELSWFLRKLLILIYLFNTLETRQETSGKILLYIFAIAIYGQYPDVDKMIDEWGNVLQNECYSEGAREMLEIYFGPTHPFATYARTDFKVI